MPNPFTPVLVGAVAGDGTGDKGQVPFGKVNANFQLLSTFLQPYNTGPSPAENTLGIVPLNLGFPPGNVLRYGALGTGAVNASIDTLAFNTAFSVCKLGGGVVYFPAPPLAYFLNAPINATQIVGAAPVGYLVRGEAGLTQSQTSPFIPPIIATHTGHVFDLAGAQQITWEDVSIGTLAGNTAATGWFMARNAHNSNSQLHRFARCRAWGNFRYAVVYNFGSESEVYEACQFANIAGQNGAFSGTKVMIWTGTNTFGLSSSFLTISAGPESCTDHTLLGGQFINFAHDATADVLYAESAAKITVVGPLMSCSDTTAGGRSLILMDNSVSGAQGVQQVCAYNIKGNSGAIFQPTHGVYVLDAAAGPIDVNVGCTFIDCNLNALTDHIAVSGPNSTIDSWRIEGLNAQITPVVSVPGKSLGCTFNTPATTLTLGTSQQNWIQAWAGAGYTTITTRDRDEFFDVQNVATGWTPNISALTGLTGTLVATGTIAYDGREVTVNVNIAGVTGGSVTAGLQITGLPALAKPKTASALVNVIDLTANVNYGTGGSVIVSPAGISLPAFTATSGHIILITARYFAS